MPRNVPAILQAFIDARQQAGKKQCPNCGRWFQPRRSGATYRSDTCRKAAYLDRHRR